MGVVASPGREFIAALCVCALIGCTSADIGNGPPTGGAPDAAAAADGALQPDAVSIPDAAPPDARLCLEGDRRIVDADGTCYFAFETPDNWQNARDNCIANGGDLVRIDSAQENDLVFGLARSPIIADDWWVGGNDRVEEGLWVWLDDTAPIVTCQPICTPGALFQQFRANEPNNGTAAGEDCMIIESDNSNEEWDDRNCELQSYPYVCERPS